MPIQLSKLLEMEEKLTPEEKAAAWQALRSVMEVLRLAFDDARLNEDAYRTKIRVYLERMGVVNAAEEVRNLKIDGFFLILLKEAREIDEFLLALGVAEDDPSLDGVSWQELLEDARTMKQVLGKYRRRAYIPPPDPPQRGPMSKYTEWAVMVEHGVIPIEKAVKLAAMDTYSRPDVSYNDLYPEEEKQELRRARKGIKRALERK